MTGANQHEPPAQSVSVGSRPDGPPTNGGQGSSDRLGGQRAVSAVIGVVLMVGITVLLAAVVGAIALGFGDEQTASPQADFEFEQIKEGSGQPDELEVAHAGGESIDPENLYVSIGGTTVQQPGGAPPMGEQLSWTELGFGGDTVSANNAVGFEPADSTPKIDGRTVQIIWQEGESSSVLATWEGPDNS